VRELGSFEKVDTFFGDDLIGQYARQFAKELYQPGTKPLTPVGVAVAEQVGKALKYKRARASFEEITAKLDTSEAVMDDLDGLIARVVDDLVKFPDSISNPQREKLLKEMRDVRETHVPGSQPVSPIANNASGQTDVSLEALSVERSRKAAGTKYFVVDTRSHKARPAVGLRPEDNLFNPHETLVEVTKDKFTVVQSGAQAQPLTPKAFENIQQHITKS
jgi:hypothetical protein